MKDRSLRDGPVQTSMSSTEGQKSPSWQQDCAFCYTSGFSRGIFTCITCCCLWSSSRSWELTEGSLLYKGGKWGLEQENAFKHKRGINTGVCCLKQKGALGGTQKKKKYNGHRRSVSADGERWDSTSKPEPRKCLHLGLCWRVEPLVPGVGTVHCLSEYELLSSLRSKQMLQNRSASWLHT